MKREIKYLLNLNKYCWLIFISDMTKYFTQCLKENNYIKVPSNFNDIIDILYLPIAYFLYLYSCFKNFFTDPRFKKYYLNILNRKNQKILNLDENGKKITVAE